MFVCTCDYIFAAAAALAAAAAAAAAVAAYIVFIPTAIIDSILTLSSCVIILNVTVVK